MSDLTKRSELDGAGVGEGEGSGERKELERLVSSEAGKRIEGFLEAQKEGDTEDGHGRYFERMRDLEECVELIEGELGKIGGEESEECGEVLGKLHYMIGTYYVDNDDLEESEPHLLFAVKEFEKQFVIGCCFDFCEF